MQNKAFMYQFWDFRYIFSLSDCAFDLQNYSPCAKLHLNLVMFFYALQLLVISICLTALVAITDVSLASGIWLGSVRRIWVQQFDKNVLAVLASKLLFVRLISAFSMQIILLNHNILFSRFLANKLWFLQQSVLVSSVKAELTLDIIFSLMCHGRVDFIQLLYINALYRYLECFKNSTSSVDLA